ncbi:MAG: hypothetical protein ACRECP_00520, partial [Methylocella sp.]
MFFYLSMNQFVYAQAQNPAVITGVSSGGVGFVTVTTDQNGINAQVGAWGTPYPYGANGPPLQGVEPSGASILSVDISVGNGGLLQFSYSLNTYDAALYDWLDISLSTPTGIVPIVTHLGN